MYIEIENLSKKLNGVSVLENVSVRFEQGKVYGLKGPNGSGKTMLMRAVCGLIIPSKGHVDINGKILGKNISFPESIGILIENPGFISNYSGYKNLEILASIRNKIHAETIREILTRVGLDEADKKKYRKYSLGMKQKLGIAAAIMEDPEILLLDEPLNALDDTGVDTVRKIIRQARENGKIILLTCHDYLELQALSDEIFIMEKGKIIDHIIPDENLSEGGKYTHDEA